MLVAVVVTIFNVVVVHTVNIVLIVVAFVVIQLQYNSVLTIVAVLAFETWWQLNCSDK